MKHFNRTLYCTKVFDCDLGRASCASAEKKLLHLHFTPQTRSTFSFRMPPRDPFAHVPRRDLINIEDKAIIRNGIRMDSTRNRFEEYMCEIRAKIPRAQPENKFDHHNSPDLIRLVPSRYFRQFGIEKDAEICANQTPFNYHTEDIENQIKEWHDKKTRWEVNSIKIDTRLDPCPGAFIYKKSGATAGQLISLNLIEIEMLVDFLSSIILPGIMEAGSEIAKLKRRKFDFKRSTTVFTPIPLLEIGVPRDRIWKESPPIPKAEETKNKIDIQRNSAMYYENGEYSCESVVVHASKIGSRWFIGLYKKEGKEKYQSVWFSPFEAQWLIFYLTQIYTSLTSKLRQ